MSTLTQFLGISQALDTHAQYEVIENEIIKSTDFNGLNISGSLFSLTTFKNVTFKSCVFYGSRLENCDFVDCTFEDCTFEFNNFVHCNFIGTTFENCKWAYSYLRKSSLYDCKLDPATRSAISVENNKLERCGAPQNDLTWTQVLTAQEVATGLGDKDVSKASYQKKSA